MHIKSDTMNLVRAYFSGSIYSITLSIEQIHLPTFALHLSTHIHKYNRYFSFVLFCLLHLFHLHKY